MPNISIAFIDPVSKRGVSAKIESAGNGNRYFASIADISDGKVRPIKGESAPVANLKDNIGRFLDRFAFEADQKLGNSAPLTFLQLKSVAPKTYEATVSLLKDEKEIPIRRETVSPKNFDRESRRFIEKLSKDPASQGFCSEFFNSISKIN